MTELNDAETLAKVNEALQILEVQLASAEATEAAVERGRAAAESRLAPLLAEQRRGTETTSVVGAMPMNGGGYRYTATPPSASTRRVDRAQKACDAARREAQVASSVIFAIRLKRDRLLRVRTTLQKPEAGPGEPSEHESGPTSE
jgi:hypothetical protein